MRPKIESLDLKKFHEVSDLQGFLAVATTWAMITGSFALVAYLPNPITVLIALVILGGRHLALAILMHDASHYSLFKTKKLNDWIGSWICSYPTWQDLKRYRKHHMDHHLYAGSEKDPDVSLVRGYPTTRASMARKLFRDAIGITGLKRVYGLLLMDFGFITYTASAESKRIPQEGRALSNVIATGIKNLYGVVITHLILYWILRASGHPHLYWLWVISYFTTFSVFVRIRSIAEHACLEMDLDPMKCTRTTYASPLARVTVAPHHVNYHLEHHLYMGIPSFRFPELHRKLKESGALKNAHIAQNYLQVLTLSSNPKS